MGMKVVILAFGLLVLAATYSFFSLYERVETTIDTGYSDEARRNPYLAAKNYLERFQVETETSTEMTVLDRLQFGETLFVTNGSTVRSQERKDQLLNWVSEGGRLILSVSEQDVTQQRSIVSDLGFEVDYIAAAYPRFRECADLEVFKRNRNPSVAGDSADGLAEMMEESNRQSREKAKKSANSAVETGKMMWWQRHFISQRMKLESVLPRSVGAKGLSQLSPILNYGSLTELACSTMHFCYGHFPRNPVGSIFFMAALCLRFLCKSGAQGTSS